MLNKVLFETVSWLLSAAWVLGDLHVTDKVCDKIEEKYSHIEETKAVCIRVGVYTVLCVPFVAAYHWVKNMIYDK